MTGPAHGFSDWTDGPFPFSDGNTTADAPSRLTYFDRRIGRALYGGETPTRYHRRVDVTHERTGFSATSLELSLLPDGSDAPDALLVVHGNLPREQPLQALHALSQLGSGGHTREWYEGLPGDTRVAPSATRVTTLSFFTPSGDIERPMPPEYSSWTGQEQWLWLLASATPFETYPPPLDAREQLAAHLLHFSRDWSALVLRDGAAFLGARDDEGAGDPFFNSAELYFRSVYLDALLLGMIQRVGLDSIAEDIASVDDPQLQPEQVQRIGRRLSRFRNVYWWSHLSGHGHANDLTAEYARQHRLPELSNQLFGELSEFSRQIQTAATDRTNALLGLITLLGLPIGATIGVLQVLGSDSALVLGITLIVAVGLTFGVIRVVARPVFDPMLRALRAQSEDREPGSPAP